jgi:hypothetical protein
LRLFREQGAECRRVARVPGGNELDDRIDDGFASLHGNTLVTAQRQIVTSLEKALEARRQRIIVSRSSVNWVKWACLHAQAVCTLAAIAIDPR